MPDIKEKPKMGKPKARDRSAMLPKQTARMMKEKYLQTLEQRPEDGDDTVRAPDQVEEMGRWAVGELTAAPRRSEGRRQRVKEKKRPNQEPPPPDTDAAPDGGSPDPERPAGAPKERQTIKRRDRPAEQRTAAPKERAAARTLKERPASRTTPLSGQTNPQAPDPAPAPDRAASPRQAQRQFTLNNRRRGSAAYHPPAGSTGPWSASSTPVSGDARPSHRAGVHGGVPRPPAATSSPAAGAVKERAQVVKATLKTRPTARGAAKAGRVTPRPRPAAPRPGVQMAARKARQQIQQRAARVMNTKAARAARTAAVAAKRVAVAVVKAAAALVGAVAGIAGGGILLVALVIVVVIAAVANSPFGLFFAEERNAPDTVSVAEAVSTVNMAYNARLEDLQAGDYDGIVIHGQAADWPDVLAVFAVKLAGADVNGIDVATLDADRVDKLTVVFWDMTAITTYVEEIPHEDWTEYILHITITPKAADDMRTAYTFTDYQNSALDELLADRAALSALAGSLTITNADVSAVLDALPDGLDPERREAVRTALTLVGKVNYFWGGKSYAIGWDSRWGTLQKVWAAGSSTTGTYRPFGLDCSGFVDWIFNNSVGYIIGHGGGVIMQHTYCTDIPWSETQPGDLAFFPDDSHIGIVVGRSADGGILVCHCSSGQNNVVITDCAATGFTAIGRPDVFD